MSIVRERPSTLTILPCPFCGSEASLSQPTCYPSTPYNPRDRLYPTVRCNGCGALVDGKNEDYRGDTAIVTWNRREPERTEGHER